MAAVSPAGPEPTMTTFRRSVIMRCHTPLGVREGAAGAEQGTQHQVRDPYLVIEEVDGAHPDEADAQEDEDGHADDADDDAEDDASGRHDGRADGLVVDGGDHAVNRVEG